MPTILEVEPGELIEKVASILKKEKIVAPPEWAKYVKTGHHKQRPPMQEDWWYLRCAAVLRKVYRYGPVGVSRLRSAYGGRKNRGHKPEHFVKGSGSVIRKALQQLDGAGLIKSLDKKGKVITPKGQSILDKAAKSHKPEGGKK